MHGGNYGSSQENNRRQLYPDTEFVNPLMRHSWGQRVVRFYDPDGNLIEVGTPI